MVDISQAHRTLNTGVIGHTIHFAEPFDVSQWLLLAHWADKAASGARTELAAAMCVNRFESAADEKTQFALLQKTDGWDQSNFIRKGGWTIAPDTKEAVAGAAGLCAEQLMNAKIPEPKAAATAG